MLPARKMSKGFTLVELLVVMAILGILAALTLTSFSSARRAARDTQRKSDLEQIRSALEMYRSDVGAYPGTISGGIIGPGGQTYLEAMSDPDTDKIYYYLSADPFTTYNLCATLENVSAGTPCPGTVSCASGATSYTCNYGVHQP